MTYSIPDGAPHFLIVGACKAGTTTLYDDLAEHPNAAMPSEKEPDVLHKASGAMDALYLWREHFANYSKDCIRGEASTYYTMVPTFSDQSRLAREALGPNARIIYMMRHPLRRIESHLAHDHAVGRLINTDFNSAALQIPRYVDWSDYPRQIAPWIEAFGRSNILPVVFEHFINDRHNTAKAVARFVGLNPDQLPPREGHSNARGSQRVARSAWLQRIIDSPSYRRRIRPLIPKQVRNLSITTMTYRAQAPMFQLSPETIAVLNRRLAHVPGQLCALGIEPGPWQTRTAE